MGEPAAIRRALQRGGEARRRERRTGGRAGPGPMTLSWDNYPPVGVLVLGSGTSTGIPVIGCRCRVCTSTNPRNKRLRSSLRLRVNGQALLVDCGVDFRQQMLTYPTPRLDAVLITHTHADHIHGLDDLRAFCFHQRQAIPIYTSGPFIDDIRLRFAYAFDPPQIGGGVPRLDLRPVRPGEPFDVGGVDVLPIQIMHGHLPILGFRLGRFAYLTDCSGIPEETYRLLEGVETVIISGLRWTPHPTHFSIDQSLEAARRMGARRAYLIHMACAVEHEEADARLPDWARLTYDGLELEVR